MNQKKLCIEVLASNHIDNLTGVIQDAIENAAGHNDPSDAISGIVTGLSPAPAQSVIRHAASESGLDMNWNSGTFDVYEPKVEKTLDKLDVEDYQQYDNPEQSMERDAYRRACENRAWALVNGIGDINAADSIIVIYDDDGANRKARAFIDNILAEGGNVVPVPVEGVARDDADENESSADAPASPDMPASPDVPAGEHDRSEEGLADFLE